MSEEANAILNPGLQADLDWPMDASTDAQGGAAARDASENGERRSGEAADYAYLTDEEILGMEPAGSSRRRDNKGQNGKTGDLVGRDSGSGEGKSEDHQGNGTNAARTTRPGEPGNDAAMPVWMQTLASDPQHGPEARQLWQDHQAFRSAFSSPQEAREIKELFPGGVQDARVLRQASQAVDQLDAAIYSGDARAQSEVVGELARANPAAFRSLFAEAAKVLAGMGGAGISAGSPAGSPAELSGGRGNNFAGNGKGTGPTGGEIREGQGSDSWPGLDGAPSRNHNVSASANANANSNAATGATGKPADTAAAGAAHRFDPAASA